ncbi:hypothetical protein QFC22_002856 [Naganishia vaughanmartiniae]|uniref:Uncharacterized protein n=1 Tax=Naganishia vaughanmartiniae TaxID=1424756 RepID=A0ACC2XB95_9TREE|nr:hypothetical protein QFC22_002856 [Naganishia vaughanmartiniae]
MSFPYPKSAVYLKSIDPSYRYEFAYKPPQTQPQGKKGAAAAATVVDEEEAMAAMNEEEAMGMAGGSSGGLDKLAGAEVDADDVPLRPVEKKRLDWRGKTYLAPLTTVGNLVRPTFVTRKSTPLTLASNSLARARAHSHSDVSASPTVQTSRVAKWSSPNPSSAAPARNGP